MSEIWSINRIGEVVDVDAKLHRAKVHFEDLDDLTSEWLPVIISGAVSRQDYRLPAKGDQVVCCFLSAGTEEGFVIGAYYRESDAPEESGENIIYTRFPDGSLVKWSDGALLVIAKQGVTITGNVHVNGTVTATGDVVASGVSLNSHVHGGVQSGGATTSGPQ